MKRIFFLLALTLSVSATGAQDITGKWNGAINTGVSKLRLIFDISAVDGGFRTSMVSIDQTSLSIPASTTIYSAPELTVRFDNLNAVFKGNLSEDGATIEGTFTQNNYPFALKLVPGDIELKRPQTPQPPYPYRSEDVVFENRQAGIKLAGTLTMPSEGKKFPAVVLISGSGAQNRDEEIAGHKPFMVLADYLTRQGIAVLRFDDRGFGESGGNFAEATSADFATDAAAAVDYLRSRREIDKKKIGMAGHSEGARVAFKVAAERRDIAFVISMAGAGMPGDSILIHQNRDILNAEESVPDGYVDYYIAALERLYKVVRKHEPGYLAANADSLAGTLTEPSLYYTQTREQLRQILIQVSSSPWLYAFVKDDPVEDIRRVACPVMAINGNRDLQVSSANLAHIESALRSSDNVRFNIREYPGLNHLFQTSQTGKIQEYALIEETISPRVLEDIGKWILKITE